MLQKHKSKLHKGFDKMCSRQNKKPDSVKIQLPIHDTLPKNFKGKYKHYFKVENNKWNGMNLKNLRNRFNVIRVGGMYGKFEINTNGKYVLSMYGKSILKKRQKKINSNNF